MSLCSRSPHSNHCTFSTIYHFSFRYLSPLSPLSIPHSARLPDGVLFCHCDRSGKVRRVVLWEWFNQQQALPSWRLWLILHLNDSDYGFTDYNDPHDGKMYQICIQRVDTKSILIMSLLIFKPNRRENQRDIKFSSLVWPLQGHFIQYALKIKMMFALAFLDMRLNALIPRQKFLFGFIFFTFPPDNCKPEIASRPSFKPWKWVTCSPLQQKEKSLVKQASAPHSERLKSVGLKCLHGC